MDTQAGVGEFGSRYPVKIQKEFIKSWWQDPALGLNSNFGVREIQKDEKINIGSWF